MKCLWLPITTTILCSIVVVKIEASAIPMWEFLTKEEKMSYLYSMFANQVSEFCGTSSMANCNKELLKYGLDKLKDMPEDHLDVMDPYQRGANNIIWGSMMEGHEMMKSQTTPTSQDDVSLGENVYVVTPPKNYHFQPTEGAPNVKLHLDGRPVAGGVSRIPPDEDLRQYQMSKAKIPRF